MSTPSHEEAWDPVAQPSDPSTLPPGFYFAPGTGPHAAPRARPPVVTWLLTAVGALVVIAVVVGVVLFLL